MQFVTQISQIPNSHEAVNELIAPLRRDGLSCLVVYYTDNHDPEVIRQTLLTAFPSIPFIGCSSCKGLMTEAGHFKEPIIGLMAFYDPGSHAYGSGFSEILSDTNIKSATNHALNQALVMANRVGEVPSVIVLHSTPGHEEEIISHIRKLFGTLVPIIGGSAADSKVHGHWSVLSDKKTSQNGLVLQLCFPSSPISYGFSAGYSPTEFVGVVTKSNGRILLEIDHEPAKKIYTEWVSDHSNIEISDQYIFEHVTSFPLGRVVGDLYEQPYYKLTHPIRITDNGGLELFANIYEGEEVTLMTGSREQLVNRASRVIKETNAINYTNSPIIGAISIYCAGAMLRLGDDIVRVQQQMKKQLNDTPFICPFTFGEQGRFSGGDYAHGNLMISSVLFYDSE